MSDPAAAVSALLVATPPGERPARLMEVIRHAAAGLEITQGREAAAEALYQLADYVAART